MSFQAMSWAVERECPTPTSKLILILLANYADEHNSCFPSRERISKLSNCDERTVRRSLKQLQDLGLIRIESRHTTEGRQTSNRYFICLDNVSSRNESGVTDLYGGRVTNLTPSREASCPPTLSEEPVTKNQYPKPFEQWWATYPRRDGSKKKAFEAWRKVIKEISTDDLLRITVHFARARHGQDQRYTPHATTWLNQRRFETVDEVRQQTRNKNQLAG